MEHTVVFIYMEETRQIQSLAESFCMGSDSSFGSTVRGIFETKIGLLNYNTLFSHYSIINHVTQCHRKQYKQLQYLVSPAFSMFLCPLQSYVLCIFLVLQHSGGTVYIRCVILTGQLLTEEFM